MYEVPEQLNLRKERGITCAFVYAIELRVAAGQRLCLDFAKVVKITPAALAYLLAAIHRLRLAYGDDCLTGTYPSNPALERQLSETGFYKLLKVRSRPDAVKRSATVRHIEFRSEQAISAETIALMRQEILRDDLKMPLIVAKTIFRALSEAMTNVHHHAYERKSYRSSKRAKPLVGRWWLQASLDVKNDVFSLVFYDAGVGIPRTLPRTHPSERIREVLSLLPGFPPDDGQMIKAAMELGRGRTMMSHRGKGLLDLAKLIDQVGDGEMRIHSRNGSLVYTPRGSTTQNHGGFVEGTLIEWRLPLKKAVEALPEEFYEATEAQD